ncbi:TetR family transcriptional regulator C-terminal domain-containing protein, partial [Sphingomonas lycopersici]
PEIIVIWLIAPSPVPVQTPALAPVPSQNITRSLQGGPHRSDTAFFAEAADIPTTPSAPCGCVIVLGAINVPAEYQDIADTLRDLREQERVFFVDRLKRGVVDGQLDAAMDVKAVATPLLTLLEGMSIEAGDSAAKTRLQ